MFLMFLKCFFVFVFFMQKRKLHKERSNIELKSSQQSIMNCATLPEVVNLS